MDNKGYTLVETSVAVAIFAIIIVAGSSLLLYANDVSGKIRLKNELLLNARVAADFLSTQIRYAEGYVIQADGGNLKSLKVGYKDGYPIPSYTTHEFEFNSDNKKLTFGNQLLAEHISEIQVEVGTEMLSFTIKTLEKISDESKLSVECVEITFKESVKYKTNTISE